MRLKFLGIFTIITILVGLLAMPYGGPVAAVEEAATAQEGALVKVEGLVLDELAESGTTDFFVWMTEKADLSPAAALETKQEKGRFVFETLVETAERTQGALRESLDKQGVDYQAFYIANKVLVRGGDQALLMSIAARPDVAQITANHKFQLQEPFIEEEAPVSPEAIEPNVTFINADDVWAMGYTGAGTVMAGNDTGLDEDHPAIAPHYRGCLNPPTCTVEDHNYNWWDATNTYPTDPWDGYGHGTHTTGTMVGDDGGANQIGVAPGAQTIHCKNMTDGGSGDDGTFTECFQWDLAPWDLTGANPDPDMAPDAINNSWGYWGGGQNQFRDEIQALHAAGILVEVSAGNEGTSCSSLRSPGDYWEVLTTGSIQHLAPFPGTITGFSSRGPSSLDPGDYFPDIMAPGENIRSSVPGGTYEGGWSGTSMAGPHATALVGLMWSACPSFEGRVYDTIDLIAETAAPLTGQPGSNCGGDYVDGPNNDWGYGTIDALAAVQAVLAQCTGLGYLDGTVTDDATGDPIEGATVTGDRLEGGMWADMTDASGYYTLTVPIGTFTMTAEHPQYTSDMVVDVMVYTDTVTTQDFSLVPRGLLHGTVTDADNGFALEAMITVDGVGSVWTDPATGYYEIYLDEGTYDVTAEATDYAPETATVNIVSGEETQQDFALLAAVVFSPWPVHVTLDWQTIDSLPVTLTNRMDGPYDFEFMEGRAGFKPLMAAGEKVSGRGEWLYRATTGVPMMNNRGEEELAYPSAYRWTADSPSQVSVLIYADDYYHWAPNTFLDQALQALGMSYTAHYDADFSGFVNDLGSGTWDMVLVGNDNYADTSVFSPLNDYVLDGGKLIINSWTMSQDPFNSLWSTLGVTWMSDDGDPPDPIYWWDPSHGIFNDPESVPEFTQLQAGRYGIYGQRVDWTDGFEALAGYTTPGPDPSQAALVLGNDGRTIFKGFLDGQNDADLDSDSTYDGVELWINMISGLEAGFGGDVPWFGQDPVSGSVPAESSINATLLFTATYDAGVNQPGDYETTLLVNGDPSLEVPVTMTVLPGADMGKVYGTVLDNCTGGPVEAHVAIDAGDPITETMADPETGAYTAWLVEGSYELVFTAADYLPYTATVEIIADEEMMLDVDLVPDRPCLAVSPDLLEVWLLGNTPVYTHPTGLTLSNWGAQSAEFAIIEISGTTHSAVQTMSPLGAVTSAGRSDDVAFAPAVPTAPTSINGTGALLVQDLDPWGYPAWTSIMAANGIPYDVIGSASIPGYDFSLYKMVIIPGVQGSSYNTIFNNNLAQFEDFIDAGGLVLMSYCEQSSYLPYRLPPFGGVNNYTTYDQNYIVEPDHPIFAGVSNPYTGNSASHSYLTDLLPGDRVLVTSGTSPGGEVIMIERDHGAGMLVAGGQTFEWGWYNGQGAGLILENMIPHYYFNWQPAGDVPWVWEEPITGTVPALSTMDVGVWFTSIVTDPLPFGTYTATLIVNNDDPVAGPQNVLALMHVVEDFEPPTPSFESNSPVLVHETVVFTNTTVPGIPPMTTYEWDFGDGMTSTLESPTHVYDMYDVYTVTLEACNSEMICAEYADTVEIMPLELYLPILLRNF